MSQTWSSGLGWQSDTDWSWVRVPTRLIASQCCVVCANFLFFVDSAQVKICVSSLMRLCCWVGMAIAWRCMCTSIREETKLLLDVWYPKSSPIRYQCSYVVNGHIALEMKIVLITPISEAWGKTPKWVKWQIQMRKERREGEEGKRERGWGLAVKGRW